MDLAIKDVQRHVGKFVATIIGVGLLMAIVLIMNGIYQGNTSDGVWLIDNTATDLWVVEHGRGGPFNEQSRMAEESWESV
ncbi:MAG: ABC transporter permease, partial [Chlorobiaceae bacterium]|nr:ABC transporter permease [Chlorobiaceae bacterium]